MFQFVKFAKKHNDLYIYEEIQKKRHILIYINIPMAINIDDLWYYYHNDKISSIRTYTNLLFVQQVAEIQKKLEKKGYLIINTGNALYKMLINTCEAKILTFSVRCCNNSPIEYMCLFPYIYKILVLSK